MKIGNVTVERLYVGSTLLPYVNYGLERIFGSLHYKKNDLIEIPTTELKGITCSVQDSNNIILTGIKGTSNISLAVIDKSSTNLVQLKSITQTIPSLQTSSTNNRFFTPIIYNNNIYAIASSSDKITSTMKTSLFEISLSTLNVNKTVNLNNPSGNSSGAKCVRPITCICNDGSKFLLGGFWTEFGTYNEAGLVSYTYSLSRGSELRNSHVGSIFELIPSTKVQNKTYAGVGSGSFITNVYTNSLYTLDGLDISSLTKKLSNFVCLIQHQDFDYAVINKNICIKSNDLFSTYTELDPNNNPFKKKNTQITKCVAFGDYVYFGGDNGIVARYNIQSSKFEGYEPFPITTAYGVTEMVLDETNKIIYVCCYNTIAKYYIDKIE